MRLFEAEAKALLHRQGVRVPAGQWVCDEADLTGALAQVGRPTVLKAQVLRGGRHKSGLVRVLSADDPPHAAAEFYRRVVAGPEPCAGVLVEQHVPHEHEVYLLLDVDDLSGDIRCWTSVAGGVDIEDDMNELARMDVAADAALDRAAFASGLAGRLPNAAVTAVAEAADALITAMRRCDAEIIEINPLGVTDDSAIVLDAKVTLDDNALYRQDGVIVTDGPAARVRQPADELAARAHRAGLTYVALDGDIALLSMGAGFGMAVMDLIAEHGGSVANFIDTSGGVSVADVQELADIVLCRANQVAARAVVISFVITASSLRNVVEGLVAALEAHSERPPVFSTFNAGAAATVSMSYDDAAARLRAAGVQVEPDLTRTVAAAVARPARGRS